MSKIEDALSYMYERKKEIDLNDLESRVEVGFEGADMKIENAIVEKVDDYVFVFSKEYPPFFKTVNETVWFYQEDSDGNKQKLWS